MGIASKIAKKVSKPIKNYFMTLVHDKNKLVLKVRGAKEKGHVEVRGKKGYEGKCYSKKDKLHTLLDKLDAATVSKLFGTDDEVYLNHKNIRTKPSIQQAKKILKKNK